MSLPHKYLLPRFLVLLHPQILSTHHLNIYVTAYLLYVPPRLPTLAQHSQLASHCNRKIEGEKDSSKFLVTASTVLGNLALCCSLNEPNLFPHLKIFVFILPRLWKALSLEIQVACLSIV